MLASFFLNQKVNLVLTKFQRMLFSEKFVTKTFAKSKLKLTNPVPLEKVYMAYITI